MVTAYDVCLAGTSLLGQFEKFYNFSESREDLQSRLAELNPSWTSSCSPGEIAPDGDVHIEPGAEEVLPIR